MCKGNCTANTEAASVPHVRIKLADYAFLNESIDNLQSLLDTAEATLKRYKAAMGRISELCPVTDDARKFVGEIARDCIIPLLPKPVAETKPGLEAIK